MKVIFSNSGTGPYSIHQDEERFLVVSHRGPKIFISGYSEEEVIGGIRKRIGEVRIEEFKNNIDAYDAILNELKVNQIKFPYNV